jgi:MFS family permease
LRAAPAAGAAIVAFLLATRPITKRVGQRLLAAVAVFGLAMLVFAFSTWFWLSMAALAVSGAADMISVYIRQSLIQFATPDGMRGRVSSVSFIFISASNELGEFESGVAARFLGPVGAVVLGGAVAIATALAWRGWFPALARADSFEGSALGLVATDPARIAPRLPEEEAAPAPKHS